MGTPAGGFVSAVLGLLEPMSTPGDREAAQDGVQGVGSGFHVEHPAARGARPRPPSRRSGWTPSNNQKALLSAAVSEPHQANNRQALADAAGVALDTVNGWWRKAEFRAWWNEQLLDLARTCLGPAVMSLQAMMEDASVPASAKIRAVETMVRVVGQPSQSMGHAVAAILERWNGNGTVRLAGRAGQLAMEISETGHPPAVVGGDNPSPDSGMEQNCPERNIRTIIGTSDANPSEGSGLRVEPPVMMSPATANRAAAGVVSAIRQAVRDGTEAATAPPPDTGPGVDGHHPLPLPPAASTTRLIVEGRAGQNKEEFPTDPEASRAHSPAQVPEDSSGQPVDGAAEPQAMTTAGRVGAKPPPSGDGDGESVDERW